VEEEKQKYFMVQVTNTVAYPRTMMVHSHYAVVANATMMGSWWPERFAFVAIFPDT